LKCPLPYRSIGDQCLFFSQPYPPWGISENWTEAYLVSARLWYCNNHITEMHNYVAVMHGHIEEHSDKVRKLMLRSLCDFGNCTQLFFSRQNKPLFCQVTFSNLGKDQRLIVSLPQILSRYSDNLKLHKKLVLANSKVIFRM
jgi:hypothetical protein